jgi:RNA polymerase sigma factor (sigma-70 family)
MLSLNPPTDADLVGAARRGDRSAWQELLNRHDRVLVAVCRAHRLSPHDVEDVRQTTWLRAIEHLPELKHPERIGAWLATIARREALRVIQHFARVRACDDEVLQRQPDRSPAPPERVLAGERRSAVKAAITALPERDRALLARLYSETEPSYAQIGQDLRMPIGSIGPTRGRVLERLRRQQPVARLAAAA